jgi:hypothetical protein
LGPNNTELQSAFRYQQLTTPLAATSTHPLANMSDGNTTTVSDGVVLYDNVVKASDTPIELRARIDELEANQTKLLELVFDTVKQRADSVGKDQYVKLLEEALRKLEAALKESKQAVNQLQERLENMERENAHLVLAAKMYKAESEARNAKLVSASTRKGNILTSHRSAGSTDLLQSDHNASLFDQMPELPHGRKRSLDEMQYIYSDLCHFPANQSRLQNNDETVSSSADKPKASTDQPEPKKRIVVCIACFRNGRRCDPGEPCNSCLLNRHICKCARCKKYKTGTCHVQGCTRVHEDDEQKYEKTVYAGHVAKKAKVTAPKEVDDGSDGEVRKPSNKKPPVKVPTRQVYWRRTSEADDAKR